jgi:hypothetical protein
LRLAEAESFTPLFMRKCLKSQPFDFLMSPKDLPERAKSKPKIDRVNDQSYNPNNGRET